MSGADVGRPTPPAPDWLAGGGEVGALMRAFDWSQTPVGPPDRWPQSLRIVLRILLGSRYAMWLGWGPDLTFFYNDAYARMTLGPKHPWALGRSAREVWAEIWGDIGPRAEQVIRTGQATWDEGLLLFLERRGFPEETYHTFSYSPVPDDAGGVGGMLCVVTEDTDRTIGERRLKTLRALAPSATARTAEQACEVAARTLAGNPLDLPFVLLYLIDGDDEAARLVASTGAEPGSPIAQPRVSLADATAWPFARVLATHQAERVSGLVARFGPVRHPMWPEPVGSAVVLPLAQPGEDSRLTGFLVAGLSPRRLHDEPYLDFLRLVAGQVTTAVADARAYEAERRRAEQLAEIDRAKTAFFTNISHEFRTPLTLLLGPAEDALAETRSPAQRGRLEAVHRNALRLQKLVNTLLDFSRIEAGRVRASYVPTDLGALTNELASGFRSACERAGLRLAVDCPPLGEPAYVDRGMWEKVVLNLVSNAFKFTLEGEIAVAVRDVGEAVELTVRDTGTGIPADQLPHIFERFHRVEGARARTHEGTGIGLALVQELVKLHGGTVAVESEFGTGTTFTVTVPKGTAHLPADRVEAVPELQSTALGTGHYVTEALRWLPDDGAEAVDSALVSDIRRTAAGGARPRVVWADDNADMREYVGRLLGGPFDVEAVADGEAALAAARRDPPDLILTDVMMPRLDGFGLLRAVRADDRLRATPVILLSARAGEEARVEGLGAGADDYLVKPFGARELLARVGASLKLARLRREAEERVTTILESITDALITLDRDWRYTYVNAAAERMLGRGRADLMGRVIWEAFPAAVGTALDREFRRAAADRVSVEFESLYEPWGRWFAHKVYPTADGGLAVYFDDVTGRKRAEDALREADRRKDEFLATLAHELRNPLAPIRNSLHILRLSGGDRATADRACEMMDRQVSHLVRLVDDLMEVSRITRGKIELRPERVELAGVLRGAVETSRSLIEAGRHRLATALPPEPLVLDADPVRLTQVFANLLNNAAKYTDDGGCVWLSARQDGGQAVVSVRDDGPGIPADMLPRVFDLFTQVDRTLGRAQGGLGIGLSLVKNLVHLHGGTVEAHSDGPGTGSEFVVRLPLADGADRSTPSADRSALVLPSRRVLVVDDNRDAADSLGSLLKFAGAEVQVVHDGPSALARLAAYRPEVVLLDIGMPEMDGHEVVRRIRQQPELRDVLVVALTGWSQEEDRQRSKAAGFDDHLVKPVRLEALHALIAAVGNGQRPHRRADPAQEQAAGS